MNGAGVRVSGDEETVRRQTDALLAVTRSWDELFAWSKAEFRRLADAQGWTGDIQVPLRVWQDQLPPSREVSRDALARFTGVDVDQARGQWP